jgi:hypothetical protein
MLGTPELALILLFVLAPTIPAVIIGVKAGLSYAWVGIIPVGNVVVLANVARQSGWLALTAFVPIVGWVVHAWLWAEVCRRTGQQQALGWLTLLPLVGIVFPWVIALSAREMHDHPSAAREPTAF